MMVDSSRLIFIHGSDSSSQTYKATLLRQRYPDMVVPDFTGSFSERMQQLQEALGEADGWTIIGSSMGGAMAALFAARHPRQVRKLVLLAPALVLWEFKNQVKRPIEVPCIILHGTRDKVVPLRTNRRLAEKFFPDLRYMVVEDDHRLHKTAETVDWETLLN